MTKILFVCHGNICRSPMAEFVMKDMTEQRGISDLFEIASAATSREEIGNPVYPPVKKLLESKGLSCSGKTARQITKEDYDYYDYIIGAEAVNVTNIVKMMGGDPMMKVYRLLDFTRNPRDIADPWYTGDFSAAYDDIAEGCDAFLEVLHPTYNPFDLMTGGKANNADSRDTSADSKSDASETSSAPAESSASAPAPEIPVFTIPAENKTAADPAFVPGSPVRPKSGDSDSDQEEPGLDLFHRFLDYKLGKGCVSKKEERLFRDYEAVKKREKSLDDISQKTMDQIYLLLYHEMDWLSKNKPQ